MLQYTPRHAHLHIPNLIQRKKKFARLLRKEEYPSHFNESEFLTLKKIKLIHIKSTVSLVLRHLPLQRLTMPWKSKETLVESTDSSMKSTEIPRFFSSITAFSFIMGSTVRQKIFSVLLKKVKCVLKQII